MKDIKLYDLLKDRVSILDLNDFYQKYNLCFICMDGRIAKLELN